MEIERKWLLKEIPKNLRLVRGSYIEQIYLSVEPEVRLRKHITAKVPYRMTVKGNGTLCREEIECEVPAEFYEQIERFIGKPAIVKSYYIFNCNGYPLCVSSVDYGEFIYAEVEFETEEQAKEFVLPIDDAVEVTDDPAYKMKNYWKSTRLAETEV